MPLSALEYTFIQYIGFAVGALIVLGAIYFAIRRGRFSFIGTTGEFLCDSCKYNDQRYCSVPERPNVKKCGDYKSVL
jgi:hypothetical protein